MTALPLRPELQGRSPYGAPQVPARHRLNTNENPHPLPDELLADLGAALGAAALELNRYPDRDAVALRTDLAAYLSRSGTAVTPAQVWAANGPTRSCSSCPRPSSAPGAPRWASPRPTRCTR